MEKKHRKTAPYKIVENTSSGRVFKFFCEASGAAVCTTKPIIADTESTALLLAWQTEGKERLNLCHACGKWVCDTMFNADVFNCVDCSPWENPPNFCPKCGTQTPQGDTFCRKCGIRLMYGGDEDDKASREDTA